LGRKLISSIDFNPPSPSVELQQLINFGALNSDCARPLSGCINGATDPSATLQDIGQLYTDTSSGISDANELQVTVDRRFSKGLSFRAAYTFGKTMDLTSGFRARSSTYTDPFDPRLDRAPADFDVRNRFVFSGSWEIPVGARLQGNRAARVILGGWQANAIATFQSGTPFTLYSNAGSSGQNNQLERVNIIGPIHTFNARKLQSFNSTCGDGTSANYYFDPSSFDCSLTYNTTTVQPGSLASFGDMGRNAIYGPGINNWDISFLKHFKLTESKSLEFRAEMFNAFNHVQFLNPDNQGFSGTFGQVSTDRGPRLVQFALKFYF